MTFWHEVERRKQLGELAPLAAGDLTLGELVELWWRDYAVPTLAENTRRVYRHVWAKHAFTALGAYRLRDLNPLELDRFRADLASRGVGDPTIVKTLTMLQSVLGSAVRWGLLSSNPVKHVTKPSQRPSREIAPLSPRVVESLIGPLIERGQQRDAVAIAVLAYAGLRPGELLALRWSWIGERSITVRGAVAFGTEKQTKTGRSRSVRLLQPLLDDLRRFREGTQSEESALVLPSPDGEAWREHDWRNWRRRVFQPVAAAIGQAGARPYDLRHSFVSLLIHEGVSILQVAAEAGHSPQTCLSRYAHVFAEFDPADRRPAEDVIYEARRETDVRSTYAAEELAA